MLLAETIFLFTSSVQERRPPPSMTRLRRFSPRLASKHHFHETFSWFVSHCSCRAGVALRAPDRGLWLCSRPAGALQRPGRSGSGSADGRETQELHTDRGERSQKMKSFCEERRERRSGCVVSGQRPRLLHVQDLRPRRRSGQRLVGKRPGGTVEGPWFPVQLTQTSRGEI